MKYEYDRTDHGVCLSDYGHKMAFLAWNNVFIYSTSNFNELMIIAVEVGT